MKKVLLFMACATLLAACEKTPQEQQQPSGQEVAVASVSISPDQASVHVGESVQLQATVLPADAGDKTVTWTSSQPEVASVSASGLVSALAPGIATITAKAGGKSDVCVVTVTKNWVDVSGVALDSPALSLAVGESATLKATVSPADASDPSLRWKSASPDIAMVDNQGKVTALTPGQTEVTVSAGVFSATCQVTVYKEDILVESITLSATELELERGKAVRLVATVLPDNAEDKTVSWFSSDPLVASVDVGGWVNALSQGKAVITARAGDKTATCTVNVVVPVRSVSLDRLSVVLRVREAVQLQATVTPADATDQELEWTVEPSGVVSVEQNGLVKALSKGVATVTVHCSGLSASCRVTVSDDLSGTNEGIGYDQD